MLSSIFSCNPQLHSAFLELTGKRSYYAYFLDRELRHQPTSPVLNNEKVGELTSNKVFRHYCPVKETETLSTLKFQARGEKRFKDKNSLRW